MSKKNTSWYCRFKGCKNTSDFKGVHFYRFPKEDKRCEEWVKASQNEKLIGVPASQLYTRAHLCMDHFEDWCFMNITTKHSLVPNAVPNCPKLVSTKDPAAHTSSQFSAPTTSNNPNSTPSDFAVSTPSDFAVSTSSHFSVSTSTSSNSVNHNPSLLKELLLSPISTQASNTVTSLGCKFNSFENASNTPSCLESPIIVRGARGHILLKK